MAKLWFWSSMGLEKKYSLRELSLVITTVSLFCFLIGKVNLKNPLRPVVNLFGLGFQHKDDFSKIHRTTEICHNVQTTSHVVIPLHFLYNLKKIMKNLRLHICILL